MGDRQDNDFAVPPLLAEAGGGPRPHYRIQVMTGPPEGVLVARLIGPVPGALFADRVCGGLRGWGGERPFRCLLDLRRFEGLIGYDDFAFVATRRRRCAREDAPGRIALVAHGAFDRARAATLQTLFPADAVRGFEDIDSALDWLTAP